MDEVTAAPGAEAPVSAPETPQEAPVAPPVAEATPVVPHSTTDLRGDEDTLVGEFVKVVDGPHKGRLAAFTEVVDHDLKTGYPHNILVRTRDEFNQLLQVLYEHVRPFRTYKGGR